MVRSATDRVARSKVSRPTISPRVASARVTPSAFCCSQASIRSLGGSADDVDVRTFWVSPASAASGRSAAPSAPARSSGRREGGP